MSRKLIAFEEQDPFNPQNIVAGTIGIYNNNQDDYGSLSIHSVNGMTGNKYQKIPTTPKIHYPEYVSTCGKSNKFFHSREKEIYDIQAYEKLDGSNIFGFVYYDFDNNPFVSYKLRLRPFLANSRFGNFLDMFREIKPDGLDDYIATSGYNLSMELWGQLNPHLIHYPSVNLQLSVLFGRERNKNHNIIPPNNLPEHNFNVTQIKREMQWPINSNLKWSYDDLVKYYTGAQEDIEKELLPYNGNSGEGESTQFIGQEGLIVYVQEVIGPATRLRTSGNWTPYKLKPFTIQEIHWAAGSDNGISKENLRMTCFKAFEAFDEPILQDVIDLLSEDWSEVAIGIAKSNVEAILQSVKEELLFRAKVLMVYTSMEDNVDRKDKRSVMRALSTSFDKKDMSSVYAQVRHTFFEGDK